MNSGGTTTAPGSSNVVPLAPVSDTPVRPTVTKGFVISPAAAMAAMRAAGYAGRTPRDVEEMPSTAKSSPFVLYAVA